MVKIDCVKKNAFIKTERRKRAIPGVHSVSSAGQDTSSQSLL